MASPLIEGADRVRSEPLANVDEQVEPVQAESLKQVDLQLRHQGLRLDRDSAAVRVERQLDLRGHQGMDDSRPVDGPAQNAVAPHKLDLRGLALEPQAEIVKVLVEPSCLQRRPRPWRPGPPWTLGIVAQKFP